jgi:hypothetical protein
MNGYGWKARVLVLDASFNKFSFFEGNPFFSPNEALTHRIADL